VAAKDIFVLLLRSRHTTGTNF